MIYESFLHRSFLSGVADSRKALMIIKRVDSALVQNLLEICHLLQLGDLLIHVVKIMLSPVLIHVIHTYDQLIFICSDLSLKLVDVRLVLSIRSCLQSIVV